MLSQLGNAFSIKRVAIILFFVLFNWGCGSSTKGISQIFQSPFLEMADFDKQLVDLFPPIALNDSVEVKKTDTIVAITTLYELHKTAFWISSDKIKEEAWWLIDSVKMLDNEGLKTEQYATLKLSERLAHWKAQTTIPVDTAIQLDVMLTQLYINAAKDIYFGQKGNAITDTNWFIANDKYSGFLALLSQEKNIADKPSFQQFRPQIPIYYQLLDAVKFWNTIEQDSIYKSLKSVVSAKSTPQDIIYLIQKELQLKEDASSLDSAQTLLKWVNKYQYYHQLPIAKKLDSATLRVLKTPVEKYVSALKNNMEVLRWLPQNLGEEYLWVNIPAMELDYIKKENSIFHTRVVIGKSSRQTPSISSPVQHVVFNPPWGVPPTILKNDVGSGLQRSGVAYLRKKGLRAFNSKGEDVTENVTAENFKRYTFRQPPGPRNALGEIKMNMPNKQDIYIHDSPNKNDFTLRKRMLSSGCVRTQNIKTLVSLLLEDKNYPMAKIDSMITTRKTKFEKLTQPMPAYIVYLTHTLDSNGTHLRYLDDVYKRWN